MTVLTWLRSAWHHLDAPSRDRRVKAALDQLFETSPRVRSSTSDLRLVVLSDLHRGNRDRADDFLACASTYREALRFYADGDWQLYLLGDVEELWESDAQSSLEAYGLELELEAQFAKRGKLQRFFGNHDDLWESDIAVRDLLSQHIVQPDGAAKVLEGLVLEIAGLSEQNPSTLLRVLFAHGHQGSTLSDGFAPIARMFVRNVWRPIQRLTNFNTTSLSQDYKLRNQHEIALSAWAAKQERTLLVTGHTHHPVFSGEAHETELRREISEIDALIEQTHEQVDLSELGQKLSSLKSELRSRLRKTEGVALDMSQSNPAYFNSGCCCYRSGSITGIELAGDSISLVRWRYSEGKPLEAATIKREILRRDRLSHVLSRSGAS